MTRHKRSVKGLLPKKCAVNVGAGDTNAIRETVLALDRAYDALDDAIEKLDNVTHSDDKRTMTWAVKRIKSIRQAKRRVYFNGSRIDESWRRITNDFDPPRS